MCEFCEGKKLLLKEDNENTLREVCGISCGTHKRSEIKLSGHYLRTRWDTTHRDPSDCYYTAAFDEAGFNEYEGLSRHSSGGAVIRINYCPFCGRKLEGREFDIADAKEDINGVVGALIDIERVIEDFEPIVHGMKDKDGTAWLGVRMFMSMKDREKRWRGMMKAREASVRYEITNHAMADVPACECQWVPVDELLARAPDDVDETLGWMRVSVGDVQRLIDHGYVVYLYDGWFGRSRMTTEHIATHTAAREELKSQAERLRTRYNECCGLLEYDPEAYIKRFV